MLVYTNTLPDGEAAAGGADAYRAALLPLFDRLRDAERQRAVINVDGALLGLGWDGGALHVCSEGAWSASEPSATRMVHDSSLAAAALDALPGAASDQPM